MEVSWVQPSRFENWVRVVGPKKINRRRHTAQRWGHHPQKFYLIIMAYFLKSHDFWKVISSHILYIIGYDNISWISHNPFPKSGGGGDPNLLRQWFNGACLLTPAVALCCCLSEGKKTRRRLRLQYISLDLEEPPVEQTRPRPQGSDGHSPRASLNRLPSLSTPWVAPQGDGEAGDGVWLGHPEAINSVRRTLRPTRMAEVRLLRRTQSLREPAVFGSSRPVSEDLEEGSKSKYPPLRSFSLGEDKTGLERGVVSLALDKQRSYSLRLSREEVLGRESIFQRRKGGKEDGNCYAWVEVNAGNQSEERSKKFLRRPPILSAAQDRRELKEEEEEEEEEERDEEKEEE